MGGCAAEFCNNSTSKGYVMKVFPRDSQRRAEWIQNMGRVDWTPTNNSRLCEVHFSPEMWEKRLDNKPKLKLNAVPTIFGLFLKDKTFVKNTINVESHGAEPSKLSDEDSQEHGTMRKQLSDENQLTPLSKGIGCQQTISESRTAFDIIQDAKSLECKNDCVPWEDTKRLKKVIQQKNGIIERKNRVIVNLRKQLKSARYKIHNLEEKLKINKYKKALSEIFTEDQITVLVK